MIQGHAPLVLHACGERAEEKPRICHGIDNGGMWPISGVVEASQWDVNFDFFALRGTVESGLEGHDIVRRSVEECDPHGFARGSIPAVTVGEEPPRTLRVSRGGERRRGRKRRRNAFAVL